MLDSNAVTPAIILGARNAAHVDDHRRMFTFELDAEDKAKIEAVLARGKAPSADCYAWERGGPLVTFYVFNRCARRNECE